MKKVFLMLCLLGVALPYYQLLLFIQGNGSMTQFWTQAFGSYPASMLAMDLSVAALSFFDFFDLSKGTKANKPCSIYKILCLSLFSWFFPSLTLVFI
jgi:hypothetical protein